MNVRCAGDRPEPCKNRVGDLEEKGDLLARRRREGRRRCTTTVEGGLPLLYLKHRSGDCRISTYCGVQIEDGRVRGSQPLEKSPDRVTPIAHRVGSQSWLVERHDCDLATMDSPLMRSQGG
jgi:hypothetical protein